MNTLFFLVEKNLIHLNNKMQFVSSSSKTSTGRLEIMTMTIVVQDLQVCFVSSTNLLIKSYSSHINLKANIYNKLPLLIARISSFISENQDTR